MFCFVFLFWELLLLASAESTGSWGHIDLDQVTTLPLSDGAIVGESRLLSEPPLPQW